MEMYVSKLAIQSINQSSLIQTYKVHRTTQLQMGLSCFDALRKKCEADRKMVLFTGHSQCQWSNDMGTEIERAQNGLQQLAVGYILYAKGLTLKYGGYELQNVTSHRITARNRLNKKL